MIYRTLFIFVVALNVMLSPAYCDELSESQLSYQEIAIDDDQAECLREQVLAKNSLTGTEESDDMIDVGNETASPCMKATNIVVNPGPTAAPGQNGVVVMQPVAMNPEAAAKSKWVLRFTFGPIAVDYFKTDIKIENKYMNLSIKDIKLKQRGNYEAYEVWSNSNGFNPLQFIDEATNTGIFSFENQEKGFALNLVISHPKVLITDGEDPRLKNQYADISGTILGKSVDAHMRLNELIPGWRLTYGFMHFKIGAEKIIPLITFRNNSKIKYAPGANVGVYTGGAAVGTITEYDRWSFYHSKEMPFALIGYSGSFSNRITYAFPRDIVTISLIHELTMAHLNYRVYDGRADHDLNNQTINFCVGVKLFHLK